MVQIIEAMHLKPNLQQLLITGLLRGVDEVDDSEILDAILRFDKTYKLSESKWLKVNVVGGENTKRPLDFSGKITITNTKGTGKD